MSGKTVTKVVGSIHPTAIVEPGAEIDSSVVIGPYCVIGKNVKLGANVELVSHVTIDCNVTIGEGTVIYPFVSMHRPQDKKYHGEESVLKIGKNNQIREHVTMQPGTEGGGLITRVGDDCLFMVGSHVAHDCVVGNGVVMANNATLAGHVVIGDNAIIGGLAAVQQFVRIGRHAMIGGMTGVKSDVIPFGLVVGREGFLSGVNLVGLKRRGFKQESIKALREAFRDIFSEDLDIQQKPLSERVEDVAQQVKGCDEVMEIIDFIRESTSRPILSPRSSEA